jgi:hypothetical protein
MSKNEWMNGKSIEQNGWNKISSKNEWMNDKSIEQNGWNKILSKNEWMNGKTIEQIILSFKKSKMNEKF